MSDQRKHIAIHFNAGNDVNGNPRRFWIVLNREGKRIAIIDEGYEGRYALTSRFPNATEAMTHVPVTPGYYRDAMKEAS